MNLLSITHWRAFTGSLLLALVSATGLYANAAYGDIAQQPLYLNQSASPNILIMLDDSGSMQEDILPEESRLPFPGSACDYYNCDESRGGITRTFYVYPNYPYKVYGGSNYNGPPIPTFDDEFPNYWLRSHHNNKLYFDPDGSYTPWSTSDGGTMADAKPTAARFSPGDPGMTDTMNLAAEQTTDAEYLHMCADPDGCTVKTAWRDYWGRIHYSTKTLDYETYYKRSEKESYWPMTFWDYKSGDPHTIGNYNKVVLTDSQILVNGSPQDSYDNQKYAELAQKFANWFQYYRSRTLLARAGTGRAFAKQGDDIRVAFSTINYADNHSGNILGIEKFSGPPRQHFFDTLYSRKVENAGTPLRKALQVAGEYYKNSDHPWEDNPGMQDFAPLSCRAAYTILMTDGYWNGDSDYIGNVDGSNGDTITSGDGTKTYKYVPKPPYKDTAHNTLADMAMLYWKSDLRPDIPNNVPTNSDDKAFWQHMTTFTVGLGVNGSLDPKTDANALADGTKSWPTPDKGTDDSRKIDDLYHAAVDGHGKYYSASDSNEYASALSGTLTSINARTSSASAIATNSTRLDTNSKVYQARFNSGTWGGQLLAYSLDPDTGAVAGKAWDAGDKLPGASKRNIITYDPQAKKGEEFAYDSLSTAQQALFDNEALSDGTKNLGKERVNWIRGDRSTEVQNGKGAKLRNRDGVLGDIVNSDPAYVANADFRYEYLPNAPDEVAAYRQFKKDTADREAMIYVGGNDGMLHGFDADTGVEKLAYVPAALYENLPKLSQPDYQHRYYVDGAPKAIDAYFADDGSFKTVLVGGYGAGGKGIYALDVTSPSSFGTSDVLWEYSTADDSSGDLGYSFSQPTIIRANDGNWYAIMGNGYGSANGSAALYILDVQTGKKIKKMVADTGPNNGLSTVIPIDINNDRVTDYVYAGDLLGHMWRFDLSSSNASKWNIDASSAPGETSGNGQGQGQGGNSSTIQALFQAAGPKGRIQPITARPEVGRHPDGGLMVYFGTGKYYETGDAQVPSDQSLRFAQSFYGVRDNGASATLTRSSLQAQTILAEAQTGGLIGRAVSNTDVDYSKKEGWYLDLISPEAGRETERVVSQPLLRDGRVIFTTLIPSGNACDFGGSSWVMELDAINGKRLPYSVFDMNGDNEFSDGDYMTIPDGQGGTMQVPVSGQRSEIGIVKTPGIISAGRREYKYLSGSTGAIGVMTERASDSTGRKSWRQIK